MKKILAIGASSSKNSINKKFATYTANRIEDASVTVLDLNDFEMPVYSIDKEKANGIPYLAQQFKDQINTHDAIVISFAEHNGSYTAAFKNILDWASRLEGKLWAEKSLFALSTSPGKRGGATVFNLATTYLPFMGAKIISKFSLPQFNQNFSETEGVIEPEFKAAFEAQLAQFQTALKSEAVS